MSPSHHCGDGGAHHLDLVKANRTTLVACGVPPAYILITGICTYEDGRLYSARREGTSCGRNITAIILA